MNRQQPSGPIGGMITRGPLFLSLGVRAWACAIEVFLHRGFGRRYLSGQAAFVLLLIPVYSLFWEGEDTRLLGVLWIAYFAMVFVHRLSDFFRRQNDIHSRYNGRSILASLLPNCSELTLKRLLEPLLVVTGGAALAQFNAPLGVFVAIGGACLVLTMAECQFYEKRRMGELNDAAIEQQLMAEYFRHMRGER